MLNKSPKTLSNLFKKYNEKSPLQIIQDRTILEARRLLRYSDKSIKEIAYEIG
jgi:AraC-like DNA-binding protein